VTESRVCYSGASGLPWDCCHCLGRGKTSAGLSVKIALLHGFHGKGRSLQRLLLL
jgi:hypothetical protein